MEPVDTPPLGDVMRARLEALLDCIGLGPYAAGKRFGKGTLWLPRKLERRPGKPRTELTCADLDLILSTVGLDPSVLLQPILGEAERALLARIGQAFRAGAAPKARDVAKEGGADALRRLVDQGLVARRRDGTLALTKLGALYA